MRNSTHLINNEYLIVADDHVVIMSGPGEVLSGGSQMCTGGQRGEVTRINLASDWSSHVT